MRRLTLAQRVGLAASASVLVVLSLHTIVAGRTTSAEVAAWEREQAAGFAHHVADMVSEDRPSDIARTVAATASELGSFGIELKYAEASPAGDGRWVSVPLADGHGFILARATEDLSGTLRARLRRSSAFLALGVLLVLLVTVEASVYWGAALPLRRVRNQLERMSRGPWNIEAEVGGGKEIAELTQHIAAVGAALERSITQWVEAERRAASERSRIELRQKSIPALRELNLAASILGARHALSAEGTRAVRRMLAAADEIVELLGRGMEETSGRIIDAESATGAASFAAPTGGGEAGHAR